MYFKVNNVDDGMICAGVDQGGDSKVVSFDGDEYGEGGEVDGGFGEDGDDWLNRMQFAIEK